MLFSINHEGAMHIHAIAPSFDGFIIAKKTFKQNNMVRRLCRFLNRDLDLIPLNRHNTALIIPVPGRPRPADDLIAVRF